MRAYLEDVNPAYMPSLSTKKAWKSGEKWKKREEEKGENRASQEE